jgi:hypothetical protein
MPLPAGAAAAVPFSMQSSRCDSDVVEVDFARARSCQARPLCLLPAVTRDSLAVAPNEHSRPCAGGACAMCRTTATSDLTPISLQRPHAPAAAELQSLHFDQ